MRPAHALALLLSVTLAAAPVQDKPKPPVKAAPKAAKVEPKEPGKNLKVFKGQGLDDDSLDEAMDFMTVSLGVSCAHCHVKDEKQAWAFDRDAMPAKDVARTMILMTRAINKGHFKGETTVTCATCHNGRVKPEGMPPLPVPGAPRPAPPAAVDPRTKDLPELDAILAKLTAGAGGAEALLKVAGRVSKGTVDQGGGRTMQLEIAQKPGQRAITQTTARGAMKQGFDGTAGWMQRGGKTTPMDQLHCDVEAAVAAPLRLVHRLAALAGIAGLPAPHA